MVDTKVDLDISAYYKIKGSDLLTIFGNLRLIQDEGKNNEIITRESKEIGQIFTDLLVNRGNKL